MEHCFLFSPFIYLYGVWSTGRMGRPAHTIRPHTHARHDLCHINYILFAAEEQAKILNEQQCEHLYVNAEYVSSVIHSIYIFVRLHECVPQCGI